MKRQLEKLSPRQKEALEMIKLVISKNGFPPTRVELAELLGVTRNAACDLLNTLERKGYVTLHPAISRGIKVKEVAA